MPVFDTQLKKILFYSTLREAYEQLPNVETKDDIQKIIDKLLKAQTYIQ